MWAARWSKGQRQEKVQAAQRLSKGQARAAVPDRSGPARALGGALDKARAELAVASSTTATVGHL